MLSSLYRLGGLEAFFQALYPGEGPACPECDGSGVLDERLFDGDNELIASAQQCWLCGGLGRVDC